MSSCSTLCRSSHHILKYSTGEYFQVDFTYSALQRHLSVCDGEDVRELSSIWDETEGEDWIETEVNTLINIASHLLRTFCN